MIYKEAAIKNKYKGQVVYTYCREIIGKKYHQWLVPCRILELTPAEYVKLLVEEYSATVKYSPETQYLSRSWQNPADASRWMRYINQKAREKGFHV